MRAYQVSGTSRAALIFGSLAFFSNLALGLMAMNICAPVAGVLWGAAAGISGVAWSREDALRKPSAPIGAKTGAFAGLGAFLGLAVGVMIWFYLLGGQDAVAELTQVFAREVGADFYDETVGDSMIQYYPVLTTFCYGATSVGISAAAGAAAAYLYERSQIGNT